MQGLHLTADLHGVDAALPAMTVADALAALCGAAVAAAGLCAVGQLFHRFDPVPAAGDMAVVTGVTGVVLLAESHLAVHTWPELGGVTLDVYVCNFGRDNSDRAEALLALLVQAFAPQTVQRQALRRGGVQASGVAALAATAG